MVVNSGGNFANVHHQSEIAMEYANDARSWAISSIIANWAVGQMLNNSVTISFGNKTMEFLKLNDGSYSSPPGINASLTKNSDGTYTMTERTGTKYKFNTDNKIKEITDIDGNKTQFKYDSDKNLILVADDYGHWLTFGYVASGFVIISNRPKLPFGQIYL